MNIQGKDLMLFVDNKAIAMATSCSLDLTTAVNSASSKDSGCWEENSPGKLSWSMSSDSLMSADEASISTTYDQLMGLQIKRKEVDVLFTVAENANDCAGLPETGWKPAKGGWKGKAIITQSTLSGPDGDNATISVTFTGTGKLEEDASI